jgi:hypothetical protein
VSSQLLLYKSGGESGGRAAGPVPAASVAEKIPGRELASGRYDFAGTMRTANPPAASVFTVSVSPRAT